MKDVWGPDPVINPLGPAFLGGTSSPCLGPSQWLSGTESTCSSEDVGSIPGWGRSPGGGNGYPLQYSCLENIPWTEEADKLQFMGSQRVGHDCSN